MRKHYYPHIRHGKEHESPIGEYRVQMGLTIEQFCKRAGIHEFEYSCLQNGTTSPVNLRTGGLKKSAKAVCALIGAEPEDLFPRYVCKMRRNKALTYNQLSDICGHKQIDAEKELCLKQSINTAIDSLGEKLSKTMRQYFFEDLTYEEIAKINGCTRQNIGLQILRGLRMLRSKSRLKHLSQYQN